MNRSNNRCIIYCKYVLLNLFLLCNMCVFGNIEEEDEDVREVVNFGVFYDYKTALNRFINKDSDGVEQLVNLYSLRCAEPQRVISPNKAHPFIVIEGTHRTTRSILGHKLAKRIGGAVVPNPPKYMSTIDDSSKTFRKAFFTLGLYGSACDARDLVEKYPVIINGHWMFQVSFAVAKIFTPNLPPRSSPVYKWPKDMFRPDLVIFVNVAKPEDHVSHLPNLFRPHLVNVFRKWSQPFVIEFNHTRDYDELTRLSIMAINKYLGTDYNTEENNEETDSD